MSIYNCQARAQKSFGAILTSSEQALWKQAVPDKYLRRCTVALGFTPWSRLQLQRMSTYTKDKIIPDHDFQTEVSTDSSLLLSKMTRAGLCTCAGHDK